jgi:hypothetical protein
VIHNCTTLKDQREVEVLAAGTKVVARAGKGGTQYAVNGIPADDSVRESLRRMIALSTSTEAHPWDNLHGTNTPKRVGETWPINAQAAVKTSKQRGYVIKPEDMSGQTELLAVEQSDGEACLRIRATSYAKRVLGDDSRSSDQYKVIDGSAEATAEWLVPVDLSKGKRLSSLSNTLRYVYEGRRDGRRYVMEQVTQTQTVIKRLDVDSGTNADSATTQP